MYIIDATVYVPNRGNLDEKMEHELDPIPELNLLVDKINVEEPDFTNPSAGGTSWTVFEYGEHFINFADAHRRDEDWELGDFNTSGATEFAYFPVRVSENTLRMRSRELYAPVPLVRTILAQHSKLDEHGVRWDIRVNQDAAERGRIEFELYRREPSYAVYMPHPPTSTASPQVIDAEVI
jgi:hypothetical protein